MLKPTGRDAVPIRRVFVQPEEGEGAGPLAELVSNHDERALDLYLLLHAKASGGDYDVTLGAAVWARALGLAATANGKTAVSKAWKRLEDMELISRGRVGRTARVVLLMEDGSGEDYTRPVTAEDGLWFNLPHAYWHDGWFLKLDLPSKAMLLIALSLYNGFYLPFDQAKAWYGISRKTAQVGMKALVDHGLLDRDEEWVEEPMSDIGHKLEIHYTLRAPFGPHPDRTPSKKKSAAKRSAARRASAKKAQTAKKAGATKKPAGKTTESGPTKRTRLPPRAR